MYDFGLGRFFKLFFILIPFAILGMWKLIEIIIFIFDFLSRLQIVIQ